jgi:dienelactone hydrolase
MAPLPAAAAAELAFRLHVIDAQSQYSACAAIDVNRDGRLDIYSGGSWYEAPAWRRHMARQVEQIRGRFDDYSNLPLDVNGDGFTDIVSANYRSQKLYWVEHPGAKLGTWNVRLIDQPGPMETGRLHDIDGDGRLDILPNGTTFAAWWEVVPTGSTGTFRWVRHDLPAEIAGHGLGFGDLNSDGRGDLVGPRGWLEAPADRRRDRWLWHADFELHRDCSIPILVLDVDADGDSDLVWARGHNIGVYWLERTADTWRKHVIDTSVSQCHALLVADLDNDQRPEIIAGKRYLGHDGRDLGEYDPLSVYAYTFLPTSRTWQRRLVHYGGPVGFALDPKVVDLDGDGDQDVICSDIRGLHWLENLHVGPADARATNSYPPLPDYDSHKELLQVRDDSGQVRRVASPADWAIRRSHVLGHMQHVMGELPDPARRVPLDVQVLKEEATADYTRQTITFAAEPGDRVPAYLLIPHELKTKAPAMLCLHQTTKIGKGEPAGLGGLPHLHYAHELARRGYVCLVPDYPSFGDYPYDFKAGSDRLPSGSMKAIWNNLRAVDLLESLPQVDPDRIGCIGHSLGGHNTIFTGVFDQRIKAMVSSCGFTPFHDYYGGKIAGWTSDRYMPRIREVYNNDPDRVPFDFYELIAALAPRAFFTNSPLRDDNFNVQGVQKAMEAAAAVYALFGAGDRLAAEYPDAGHDFPDVQREAAYQFLDRHLKRP